MVKFDLVLNDGKIHVELIDDGEGTPESAEQFTRFKSQCKPALEQLCGNYDPNAPYLISFTDEFLYTLSKCGFEKCSVEHIKDGNGNLTNRIRVIVTETPQHG